MPSLLLLSIVIGAVGISLVFLARVIRSYPIICLGLIFILSGGILCFYKDVKQPIMGILWIAFSLISVLFAGLWLYKNQRWASWCSIGADIGLLVAAFFQYPITERRSDLLNYIDATESKATLVKYALDDKAALAEKAEVIKQVLIHVAVPVIALVVVALVGNLIFNVIIPKAKHQNKYERKHLTNVDPLIGQRVTISKDKEYGHSQRGYIGDVDWSIEPLYGYETFKVGDVVKVVSIKGVTLMCTRDGKDYRAEMKQKHMEEMAKQRVEDEKLRAKQKAIKASQKLEAEKRRLVREEEKAKQAAELRRIKEEHREQVIAERNALEKMRTDRIAAELARKLEKQKAKDAAKAKAKEEALVKKAEREEAALANKHAKEQAALDRKIAKEKALLALQEERAAKAEAEKKAKAAKAEEAAKVEAEKAAEKEAKANALKAARLEAEKKAEAKRKAEEEAKKQAEKEAKAAKAAKAEAVAKQPVKEKVVKEKKEKVVKETVVVSEKQGKFLHYDKHKFDLIYFIASGLIFALSVAFIVIFFLKVLTEHFKFIQYGFLACVIIYLCLIFVLEAIKVKQRKAAEGSVKEVVTETKVETVVEETKVEAAPEVKAEASKEKAEFVPFNVRLAQADDFVRESYNELKSEVLSYGIKSRVSTTGDTFRLHTKAYVKMVVAGKFLKLYFALDPADYKDSTYPFEDASRMGAHKDTPFVFKIKSGLSVRRAKTLIGDAAKKDGLVQGEVVKHDHFADLK